MRECSIKFLNGLINDNSTKKELEIIKFIKKCVNECCKVKQPISDDGKRMAIFEFWNKQKIIEHKAITPKITQAIDKALKTYTSEDIQTYISRYNQVIKDRTYFFDYKWTLSDFLSRKDGISAFTDEGSKWVSYKNKKRVVSEDDNFSRRDVSKDDMNSLFDDLDNIEV